MKLELDPSAFPVSPQWTLKIFKGKELTEIVLPRFSDIKAQFDSF